MSNNTSTFQKGITLFFVFFAGIFFPAYSQCGCNFTISPGATSITFDGATSGVKPGDVICISGGARERIIFSNITGDANNYVVIKNCNGEARLGSTTSSNPIMITGSRYVRLTGSGDPNIEYGIKILGSKAGTQGVAVTGLSSDIEIDHLDITKVGFAGIMAKTDPSTNCADKSAERPNYTMYNMKIHDCYFHEITGEGIYVGNSFYAGTTVYCGSTQYPHEVRGVRIYNNLFESTGWESIQVGSAVSDVEIYNNRIFNYGSANKDGQNGGIQMGLGTTGKLYNNFIKGGTGAALVVQGIGKNYVFNNIIINPGDEAINVNTRPTPLTTDIVSKGFLGGVYIINNTIVGASYAAFKEYLNDAPGNVMYNNLIVSSAATWDLTKSYYDWDRGNNVVIPLLSAAGFVNPSIDDYRLKSSSPAVNAGRDVSTFNVMFDMGNLPRPTDGKWDAGAFELAGNVNLNPVVTVNATQTILLPIATATLTGSATDADGTIRSYLWTKISGPSGGTLTNGTTTGLLLTNLVAGTYVFRLTATDDDGGTGFANATLIVQTALINQAPTANAGTDKTIVLPASSTTLNGTGTDSDGTVSSYKWTQSSGPNTAIFNNVSQAAPAISGLVSGTYILGLVVTDNLNKASLSDKVTVTVSASSTQKIVSFSLINADNDQVIQTISSASTINLANLPTNHLNIRANTEPATVGSVKFALSGAFVKNFIDNSSPPYALFGDTNGDYNAWTPALGNYSLTAIPFSATGATGKAGAALKVNFAIINKTTSASARSGSGESDATILAENGESENRISAYPNPFHESINLRIQSDSSVQYVIKFYDNFGQLLMQDKFTPASPNADTHTIHLPGISSGMHIIVVESEVSKYRKVMKVWKE